MTRLAVRVISLRRDNSIAFGGEADMIRQPELVGSVENDPELRSARL
jgi:hypothetical protein